MTSPRSGVLFAAALVMRVTMLLSRFVYAACWFVVCSSTSFVKLFSMYVLVPVTLRQFRVMYSIPLVFPVSASCT